MRIGREFYNLLVRVVDPKDDLSSKRVTLISSLIYFFISSFIYTILGVIIVFVSGKGDIEQIKIFISLIRELIYYNFLIIVSAIGLITVVDMGRAVVDKAKATLPAITMQPGSEGTVIQNAACRHCKCTKCTNC
jgi:hypothetical protein